MEFLIYLNQLWAEGSEFKFQETFLQHIQNLLITIYLSSQFAQQKPVLLKYLLGQPTEKLVGDDIFASNKIPEKFKTNAIRLLQLILNLDLRHSQDRVYKP